MIAFAVFGGLPGRSQNTGLADAAPPVAALTVRQIGQALMTDYVWPLQCVGLLLTAALIGALVLVMEESVTMSRLQLVFPQKSNRVRCDLTPNASMT